MRPHWARSNVWEGGRGEEGAELVPVLESEKGQVTQHCDPPSPRLGRRAAVPVGLQRLGWGTVTGAYLARPVVMGSGDV